MEVHYNFVTQALLGYIRTRVEHKKCAVMWVKLADQKLDYVVCFRQELIILWISLLFYFVIVSQTDDTSWQDCGLIS